MNARNGKIARLPREIREELNQRLERSDPGPKLLAWLNEQEDVKEVIQEEFEGVPISKQNLSEWRLGGFQEWLGRRDLCEEAADIADCSEKMDMAVEGELADSAATVLVARIGGMITNWNGEVDARFEAKSRVLNRLCRSVVQLQRGMHQARRVNLVVDRMVHEKEKREKEELRNELLRPFWVGWGMPQAAKLFGDSEEGRKMARYFMELQFGNVKAAFDFADHDDLKGETWAGKEEKPVKPSRKKQTVKRNCKSKVAKADKPLNSKEMEKEEGGGSGQSKSKPVKPGQTDLEEPDEDGLGVGLGLRLGKDQADGEDSGTDCLSDQSKLHSAP